MKDRADKKTLKELPNDTAGHRVDGAGQTKLERMKTVG